MPHHKCVACRTRYYAVDGPDSTVEHRCPCCGRPFEPAGELSSLVGFRVVGAPRAAATQQGLVDRLDALLERRAREEPDRDGRWDDGGRGAIAQAASRAPETIR